MAKLITEKKKESGLDGRTVSTWSEVFPQGYISPHLFTIIATPSGVRLSGTLREELETEEDFESLAEVIGAAMVEFRSFQKEAKNKIVLVDAQGKVRQR
jgi:hypothetical protein